jgi:hypothetical protein
VVVTWSKIRAARKVVKQLQVEMLHQCSSASSCMLMHIVMEEWMSAFNAFCSEWPAIRSSFSVFQYTSDITVVPCCMNSTISISFCPRNQLPSIFWQADNTCLKFFGMFLDVCASTALTALWFQHSHMKPRFHHLSLIQCDCKIHRHLCGIALKKSIKAEAILCILCAPMSIFGTRLVQNL